MPGAESSHSRHGRASRSLLSCEPPGLHRPAPRRRPGRRPRPGGRRGGRLPPGYDQRGADPDRRVPRRRRVLRPVRLPHHQPAHRRGAAAPAGSRSRTFYLRRARRLLPALYALLLAVARRSARGLGAGAGGPAARRPGGRPRPTSPTGGSSHVNSSYFAGGGDRPQLLTHLWSLAVEEQFYLVWPLVLIICCRGSGRAGGCCCRWSWPAVAASTVAAALLYDPFADPSRVYYGTDTRALAPLLGAALAIAVQPWRHRADLPVHAPARAGPVRPGRAGRARPDRVARLHDSDADRSTAAASW